MGLMLFTGVAFRVFKSLNDGMASEIHRKRGQFMKMREKRYLGNKKMEDLYNEIQKEEEK
jgi:hypothetical protein